MVTISILISLLTLFYLLGKAADLAIYNVRIIGERLGIKIFFLGVLLGFFTSLPELAVGVNAIINNIPTIAVGNLLGGIVVLFGFILGISIILNRTIIAKEKPTNFLFIFIYFILPLLFGINGNLSSIEGIILIILYLFLLYYLYWQQEHHHFFSDRFIIHKDKIIKNIFLVILGLALVVVISNIVIRFTSTLLNYWAIPPFVIGLILFSLGTNLPEIIVTLRSWQRNIKDLSLSNLIGSGMANILILGFLVFLRPISIKIGMPFYSLMFFMILLFTAVLIFYKTDKRLTRPEGIVLVIIYLFFIISQFSFIF